MFQFRRFPSYTYLIQCRICGLFPQGFPHSEIHGSKLICSSPWLIAACRVLHRLPVPRHSPCALFCLTSLGSLKNYCGNLLLGLLYLHTLCQNRKTFKLIFVHLNVFSIVAFFFPLFSFQCAFLAFRPGGDEQNRTVDPLLARQVLSQLSYTPRYYRGLLLILALFFFSEELVGSSGLEPPTSRLSGARSNHLSYEPVSLSAASVFFGFLFLCPFYGLGGDDGIRTHDPLLAGQVLSQLSYTPLGVFENLTILKN